MLYAILCYNSEAAVGAWSKQYHDETMARLHVVNDKLAKQGRLGPVARLLPTTAATTLRKSRGENLVIDGPFAETKEQLLGFYVVDCATQEEALEAARQIGGACTSRALEVRPISWFQLTDSIDHSKAAVRVEPKP